MIRAGVVLACFLGVALASPLDALRNSIHANPVISRLVNFEIARPVAEGHVLSLSESGESSLPATMRYSLNAFGRSFKLNLKKNDALMAPAYREMRIDFSEPEGTELPAPSSSPRPTCYYIGSVENEADSVVAVNLCGGIKGIFRVQDETYNIEPAVLPVSSSSAVFSHVAAAESSIEHIVFRESDIRSAEGEEEAGRAQCGVHDDDVIAKAIREEMAQAPVSGTLPAADEFTIELLAFNDHARYRMRGESVEQDTLQLGNIASAFYASTRFVRPLKMVLVGQVTFVNNDPFRVRQTSGGADSNDLLWTFNNWRHANRARLPAHDSGQLLSGLTFASGIRGLAPVGAMCNPAQSGSICQITSPSARLNAMIMAHETGHTLSMMHDTMGNSCPMGHLMQPTVSEAQTFSACSIQYTNQFLSRGAQCLRNPVQANPAARLGVAPVRWNTEEVHASEPAAKAGVSALMKEYWLAFLLGGLFGATVVGIGMIMRGVALRRRSAKNDLPTSVRTEMVPARHHGVEQPAGPTVAAADAI